MRILKALWQDEAGVILSAETVVVGTIVVIGLSTGLSVLATSVSDELKDVGFAIRSLNQSYQIAPQHAAHAHVEGSAYQQAPVEKSLRELQSVAKAAEKTNREHLRQAAQLRAQELRKRENQERAVIKKQRQQQQQERAEAELRTERIRMEDEKREARKQLEREIQMMQREIREMQKESTAMEQAKHNVRPPVSSKQRPANRKPRKQKRELLLPKVKRQDKRHQLRAFPTGNGT